jgi:acyl-CoA hydrolase
MQHSITPELRTKINPLTSTYSFTVFPDSLNYAGTLFGGKLLSEMDLAASNAARKWLYHTSCDGLVTAQLSEVNFKSPGMLGDIVEIDCTITKVGISSITVLVNVIKESKTGQSGVICTARFVFVALKDGVPFPHNIELN